LHDYDDSGFGNRKPSALKDWLVILVIVVVVGGCGYAMLREDLAEEPRPTLLEAITDSVASHSSEPRTIVGYAETVAASRAARSTMCDKLREQRAQALEQSLLPGHESAGLAAIALATSVESDCVRYGQ
jgi:hypothetical protein